MSANDKVSDFLTRIRNAYRAGHKTVEMRHSILTEKVASVMYREGYLADVQTVGSEPRRALAVKLKYADGASVITGLKRVSRPSRRVYVRCRDIKPVMEGMGLSILSTPSGILSDREARQKQMGGEVICQIW